MKDTKNDILAFWFDEISPSQWFQTNADFDAEIIKRFSQDYQFARDGVYEGWQNTPDGSLALCILLDQFPRNMFRGSPKAYETDNQILLIAKNAIAHGHDKLLEPMRRWFLYLPYEHSENINDQKACVALFEEIKDEDPLGYDYALRHLEVIERFGRFPHRNAALGRDNTPEEEEYLAAGGGF